MAVFLSYKLSVLTTCILCCRMKGVYDALDKEYLRALVFAVCIDL